MDLVWLTDDATRAQTTEILRGSGAQVKDRAGFEPMTTLMVSAGVVALARALTKLYRDARYRGVIIDTSKNPVEVRQMPGWDRQQVLLISTGGSEFHQFTSSTDLEALLAKFGVK